MTHDEAMKVWRNAFTKHNTTAALTTGDADEAAAAVIQQAFAERDGEMRVQVRQWRENLAITRNSPVMGDPLYGEALDFVIDGLDTILALAAKGDSRGD